MEKTPASLSGLRILADVAAVFTVATVAMGGVVCVLNASASCPNWPGCYIGDVLPKAEVPPLVEAIHRFVAICTTPLVLATGVWAAGRRDISRLHSWLPWVALVGCLLAGVFGMLIVLYTLPFWLGVLDLVAALTAMVAMVAFATSLGRTWTFPASAKLPLWTLGAVMLLHILALFAAKGSTERCIGWPRLSGLTVAIASIPAVGRRILVIIVVAFVIRTVLACRRASRRRWGYPLFALTLVTLVLSQITPIVGLNGPVAVAHTVASVALSAAIAWWAALHATDPESLEVGSVAGN